MKEGIDKLDFIKIKTFLSVKDTLKGMKSNEQTEREVAVSDKTVT